MILECPVTYSYLRCSCDEGFTGEYCENAVSSEEEEEGSKEDDKSMTAIIIVMSVLGSLLALGIVIVVIIAVCRRARKDSLPRCAIKLHNKLVCSRV